MITYSRCKICGYSTNDIFNKATEKTKCEIGLHIFEKIAFSAFCGEKCEKPKQFLDCMVCGKISEIFIWKDEI